MTCRLCDVHLDVDISKHLMAVHNLPFTIYEQIIAVIDKQAEIIEIIPHSAALPDNANTNTHPRENLDLVKASIIRFNGQITPATLGPNDIILKGNGTWLAIGELHTDGKLPKTMYRDGKPIFKVIRRNELAGTEGVAYSVIDNQSGKLSQWDYRLLTAVMKAMDDEGSDGATLGWKREKVDALKKAYAENPGIPPPAPDDNTTPPRLDEKDEKHLQCPACSHIAKRDDFKEAKPNEPSA